MPDPRRLFRRIADSGLPTRLIAHLSVVALVTAASFVGISSASAAASDAKGFLNLVSSVRGAGEQPVVASTSTSTSSFDTLPADEAAWLNRGAPALVPGLTTPLPTPVPLDPNATPLPAPVPAPALSLGNVITAPSARSVAPEIGAGGLVWPVPGGSVTQYFHGGHLAVDIAADYGAQVLAVQSGVVSSAGWRSNGGGYVIEIDHGNGMQTLYNHLGSIWVTAGQSVFAGQGIAGIGCTGLCTGPHVHFQVIVDGVIDNPMRYY